MKKFIETLMVIFISSTVAGFGLAGGAIAFWGWVKFLSKFWEQ
ncbi:hypothetical protein [Serratia ureilytica]|nr:hypothetical protein [Serratia ureilytica]